jgi:hypothetical protein
MFVQTTTPTQATDILASSTFSAYSRFKMALKSKEVQRQHPNLLEKFLDFCKFGGLDVQQKASRFSLFAKCKTQDFVTSTFSTTSSYIARKVFVMKGSLFRFFESSIFR